MASGSPAGAGQVAFTGRPELRPLPRSGFCIYEIPKWRAAWFP